MMVSKRIQTLILGVRVNPLNKTTNLIITFDNATIPFKSLLDNYD